MKELDVLLERFCRSELARLDDADLSHLETLLRHEDPDLYTVLVGGARLADPGRDRLAARIRDHRRVV